MDFQTLFFLLSIINLAALGALAWFLFDLRKKVLLLFGGKETDEENEFLRGATRRLTRTEAKIEEFEPRLEILEKISHVCVQKVGFLRFNPFEDTGGNQSFVAALLDRDNNGIILSSLYTREGVRIYAKNIERGKSKHPLSKEEKEVLEETIHK